MSVPHTIAAFVAALLLFGIQPWAAKTLLPQHGGSAAVWLTTMLFFQISVALGYAYAHWSTGRFGDGTRVAHVVLLVLAGVVFLPFSLAGFDITQPSLAVLAALASGLGLPMLLVGATTPFLHAWLSRDGETSPYYLFAASNAGSLVGLLAYPALVEPWFSLDSQAALWSGTFVAVVLILMISGARRRRVAHEAAPQIPVSEASEGRWFLYAFVPTSLLYGVTAHITTNVGGSPVIWVLPLALYLTTYILAFARQPLILPDIFERVAPVLLYGLALWSLVQPIGIVTTLAHLIVVTLFSLYFHGKLSKARPSDEQATRFYLITAIGGISAGALHALAVPYLFDGPIEYPLMLGLALILMPAPVGEAYSPTVRKVLHGSMMLVLAIAFTFTPGDLALKVGTGVVMAGTFFVALWLPALSHVMLVAFLGAIVTWPGDAEIVERLRSPYAAHTLERRIIGDREYLALTHGITTHGLEPVEAKTKRHALGYYHPASPCAEVFRGAQTTGRATRVGLVGLGIGSMAHFSRPSDRYEFFELDPVVIEIAQTRFGTLSSAQGDVTVTAGDGRQLLKQREDGAFDLLVIDAFSSDAIPAHLLTTEAFRLYQRKLTPDGMLLVHTSNRFLDVDHVAVGGLTESGWKHLHKRFSPNEEQQRDAAFPSSWIVAAATDAALEPMRSDTTWQTLRSELVWTDEYSSLFRALR